MSDTLDLFPGDGRAGGGRKPGLGPAQGASRAARAGAVTAPRTPDPSRAAPLAARMRPRTLDEFRGQEKVVGPGGPLRSMIETGRLSSFIMWGPPGSGKTTLARLVALSADAAFVAFSAVTEGVARVREIIAEARTRRRASGRGTILFCDEIHRFNKAQQDAFLPVVETGDIVLIGATTENPSFEVVRPLLSRAPVVVLDPLSPSDLARILSDALADEDRGLGAAHIRTHEDVVARIAEAADGDARRALGILERAAGLAGEGAALTLEVVETAVQRRFALYDKSGDQHYDHISALHKSVRGGDPDAALYWLGRMLDAGEDPLYIARRLVRMASEDVGLADPHAVGVAMACRDAFRFLGSPEGELALAQATVYLAGAPKSNRLYKGWGRALGRARETPGAAVPLHIRNAPTRLMKDLGHGRGYLYDPDQPGGVSRQHYLPDGMTRERFYDPGDAGWEADLGERLAEWRRKRSEGR